MRRTAVGAVRVDPVGGGVRTAIQGGGVHLRTDGGAPGVDHLGHVRRLEVAVDNERALHLYTSLGFAPNTTEDYYRPPL
jgi:hypothetical protein